MKKDTLRSNAILILEITLAGFALMALAYSPVCSVPFDHSTVRFCRCSNCDSDRLYKVCFCVDHGSRLLVCLAI